MSEFAVYVGDAIRRLGARRVAEALGVSREGALALAVGVATAGTVALATPNLERLRRLTEARAT